MMPNSRTQCRGTMQMYFFDILGKCLSLDFSGNVFSQVSFAIIVWNCISEENFVCQVMD